MYARIKEPEKAAGAVSQIIQALQNTVKTAGLGAIAGELAEAGEKDLALRLVEFIREPEVKAGALVSIARSLSAA